MLSVYVCLCCFLLLALQRRVLLSSRGRKRARQVLVFLVGGSCCEMLYGDRTKDTSRGGDLAVPDKVRGQLGDDPCLAGMQQGMGRA